MPYTTLIFDGWNPSHKNGDDWGMVYGIAIHIATQTLVYDEYMNFPSLEDVYRTN